MRGFRLLFAILFATLPPLAHSSAQTGTTAALSPARITPEEIDAHLRFLSSDLLEGRAPATRGGRVAAEYIASQLRAYGVQPAGDGGTYFQRVPIDVVGADPATLHVTASGKAAGTLRYPDDVVLWAG